MQVVFLVLLAGGFVAAPISLVWGWARWLLRPEERTDSAKASFSGLLFATVSGALAVSTIAYSVILDGLRHYAPPFLGVRLVGATLSLVGTIASLNGISKPNLVRWHAIGSAIGTLIFWIVALESD